MKKILFINLFLVGAFSLQANAISFIEQVEKICKTEIMYSPNPPKLSDCIKDKVENPDYKSVLSHETFSDLKK